VILPSTSTGAEGRSGPPHPFKTIASQGGFLGRLSFTISRPHIYHTRLSRPPRSISSHLISYFKAYGTTRPELITQCLQEPYADTHDFLLRHTLGSALQIMASLMHRKLGQKCTGKPVKVWSSVVPRRVQFWSCYDHNIEDG